MDLAGGAWFTGCRIDPHLGQKKSQPDCSNWLSVQGLSMKDRTETRGSTALVGALARVLLAARVAAALEARTLAATRGGQHEARQRGGSVSYTHLTLPTKA